MATRTVLIASQEQRSGQGIARMLRRRFGERTLEICHTLSVQETLTVTRARRIHLILVDVWLPSRLGGRAGNNIPELVQGLNLGSHPPLVLYSDIEQTDSSVSELQRAGAVADLLVLGHTPPEVWWQRVAQFIGLPKRVMLIGESPVMQGIKARLRQLAISNRRVLLQGETGTGKTLSARYIHENGPRQDKPFIAVNCASLTHLFAESLLFGHAQQEPSSGVAPGRPGYIQQAHSGTLFLDEISDLAIDLQGKLLHLLDNGTCRAIGADREKKVDVRVVAATSQDLQHRVANGLFRADLYYRLEQETLTLPPLRQRGQDLVLLSRAILAFYCQDNGVPHPMLLTKELEKRAGLYHWPGNIRQLENLLYQAAHTTAQRRELWIKDLPWRDPPPNVSLSGGNAGESSSFMERYRLLKEKQLSNEAVAKEMGISAATLYRHLSRSRPPVV